MIPGACFVELDKVKHDRHTFECGEKSLSIFIQKYAVRHRVAGISKTMVLPAEDTVEKAAICSYYTLSHTEIERNNLPLQLAKKLPKYPVPVLLLAKLAVHIKLHGQGIGKVTLIRALRHCLKINVSLPSYAVVVDAINSDAEQFYLQYGFNVLGSIDSKTRLYISLSTVKELFGVCD